MDAQTKKMLIEKIISDYYEYGCTENGDYNHGYADAAMNAIEEIINIDDPCLE